MASNLQNQQQQEQQLGCEFQLCPICLNLWQKRTLRKEKVLLFEENNGSQRADLFCFCRFFLSCSVLFRRQLARAGNWRRANRHLMWERTRRPRQLKLPFWQVHRRQAGGQSKHCQIPQTNTGGKYEKTYKPRINRGSGVGREGERKKEGRKERKKVVAVL